MYGDEDQNDLMQIINKEGEEVMEDKIQQIVADIDAYQEAIEEARNALAAAEQELQQELEAAYEE